MYNRKLTANRALTVGRFQPLHTGHMEIFKKALDDGYTEMVVAIGSAEKAHHYEDPFTCSERIEIIDAALKDLNRRRRNGRSFDHYHIMGVRDIGDDELWVPHLVRYVPRFDAVYVGNPRVRYLFEMENRKLGNDAYNIVDMGRTLLTNYRKNLPEPIETSGTLIRKLMAEGDETWKDLLPEPAVSKVVEFDGPERLRRLSKMG